MDPFLNENLITTKYAGELSGYTSDYLSRLIRSGKITGKRIGRNWLVDRKSLVSFLDAQGNHNVNRARTLASDRAKEYRTHRSLLRRATKSLTVSPPMSQHLGMVGSSFNSHVLALSVAFLVVVSSAFIANAEAVPMLTTNTKAIVLDVLYGFGEAFGDIQSDIASRIDAVKDAVSTTSSRIASYSVGTLLPLESPDAGDVLRFYFDLMPIENQHVRRAVSVSLLPSPSNTPMITVDDIQSFAQETYTLLSSPTHATDALANAYVALGEQTYAAITTSFTAYDSLIKKSGVQALLLAGTTRDMLARAPELIARMNLAFGESIITATHSAIQTDVLFAYGVAITAPATAHVAVALIGNTGDILASATARVATKTSTRTALVLHELGIAGYAGSTGIRSLAFALRSLGEAGSSHQKCVSWCIGFGCACNTGFG